MDLDRSVDDPPQAVGHEVLGHRHLADEVLAGLQLVGGVQDHQLALVQLHRRVGDHPLDALLVGQQRAVAVALQGAAHGHVEGGLTLGDPAHAVRQARRAEAVLAESVTLALATQQVGVGDAQVADDDLAMVVAARHGVDVTDHLPPIARQIDDERRVRRLRQVGIVLGARHHDGERRPAGAGDEPLVAVDDPLVSVAHGQGADQRRIAPGNLWLGHGEARSDPPLAQRTQITLLLLGRSPVLQGVLVAFVGRLGVEDERADAHLGRLGTDGRHRRRAEAHAAPLGGHVRQPQAPLVAGHGAQPDDGRAHRPAVVLIGRVPRRADDLIHQPADAQADLVHLRREREIDHRRTVPR